MSGRLTLRRWPGDLSIIDGGHGTWKSKWSKVDEHYQGKGFDPVVSRRGDHRGRVALGYKFQLPCIGGKQASLHAQTLDAYGMRSRQDWSPSTWLSGGRRNWSNRVDCLVD